MEQIKREFEDKVVLEGCIKHMNDNVEKNIVSIEIATYGRYVNYPTVLCFENHAEEARKFKIGDWVKITGVVETKRKMVKTENSEMPKIDYRQGVVLRSIEKAVSLKEQFFGDGAEEKSTYRSENIVALAGTVNSIKVAGIRQNCVRATIYCMNGRFKNLIMVTFYSENATALAEKFEKGDWVNIIAYIQTISAGKNSSGKKKEMLVGREISKAGYKEVLSGEEEGSEIYAV